MKFFNFHRKTGVAPGFGLSREDFGSHCVFIARLGWSAATITIKRVFK